MDDVRIHPIVLCYEELSTEKIPSATDFIMSRYQNILGKGEAGMNELKEEMLLTIGSIVEGSLDLQCVLKCWDETKLAGCPDAVEILTNAIWFTGSQVRDLVLNEVIIVSISPIMIFNIYHILQHIKM